MSIWTKLFGKQESKSAPPEQKSAHEAAVTDHWETAIAAAESGQRTVALEAFRRAIETNPDYYIGVIQPRSAQARACWNEAVERYKRAADAKASTSKVAANRCSRCGKDIGTQWHYDFESIAMDKDVGGQCPQCGLVLCDADRKFGADGNYEPCPECHVRMITLCAGKAYSSMVDGASRERRYRGAIKQPSVLGRPVIIE